jgi:hypothetical protein
MKKAVTRILIVLSLVALLFVSGCRMIVSDHDRHNPHKRGPHGPHFTTVSFKGIRTGRPQLSFTMPGGEVCQGEFKIAVWSPKATSFFSKTEYQEYYDDFSVQDGTPCGQIVAYGNQGTVIRVECFASGATFMHGYGLAKDKQNQVFPIKF